MSRSRVVCPLCRRKLYLKELKHRIGSTEFFEAFKLHVGLEWKEFDPNKKICERCHIMVRRRQRITDENGRRKFLKIDRAEMQREADEDSVRDPISEEHSTSNCSESPTSFSSNERPSTLHTTIDPHFLLTLPEQCIKDVISQLSAAQKSDLVISLPDLQCNSLQALKKDFIIDFINKMPQIQQPQDYENNLSLNGTLNDDSFDMRESVLGNDSILSMVSELDEPPFFHSQSVSDQLVPNQELSQVSTSSSAPRRQVMECTVPVRFPNMDSVKRTEKVCFVCGSKNNRCRVKLITRLDLWRREKIYIPDNNRCCREHLNNQCFTPEAVAEIRTRKSEATATGAEMSKWIMNLSDFFGRRKQPIDFEASSGLTDSDYLTLTGYNMANFETLLGCIQGHVKSSINRTVRNALGIFLMKLRLNLSQNVLRILFGISHQSVISDTIDVVSRALEEYFVPYYLGYNHLPRAELMQKHMRPFFTSVLGLKTEDLILILDGTYLYVQKASDFNLQRKTYSLHKMRNLLKPMMVVCPDGYVLEAEGLFYADHGNNDAAILKNMLHNSDSIVKVLQTADCLVLDRGFRDVIDDLKKMEINTFMPSLLNRKEKQFSTTEANSSRQITMLRWVMEALNGRLKNIFKFFDHTIPASYFPNINRFLRIATAMMNAFNPPIFTESQWHEDVLPLITERMAASNHLQTKVEVQGLDKKSAIWEEADEDCLLEFPSLSLEDLKLVTLGPYQLEMATLYNKQHLSSTGYKYFVHREAVGLIRVRLDSRYSRKQSHLIWIEFEPHGVKPDSIKGWYCKCKVGSRTLGCCSHVAAVVRYLSLDRFESLPNFRDLGASFHDATNDLKQDQAQLILEAAEALAQEEDSSDEED